MLARLKTFGIVLLLAAVAGMPISVGVATWLDHQSLRKEWTAIGPACPVVAAPSPAALGAKPPPPFTYRGARFAYQIGDVECVAAPEKNLFDSSNYTVCQFDAAGAVAVTKGGRTTIFEPGIGHGATVTVRKGQVSCAIMGAGRFHGPTVGRQLQAAKDREARPR
ncbi:hypothetical protein [Phenylobacterium sp.]|uniref:hypothetical protein n=1 Tax=Phenylobacterium sp. TaxID=1871053 RepID=UPI0035686146